jgi:hypothetical protein
VYYSCGGGGLRCTVLCRWCPLNFLYPVRTKPLVFLSSLWVVYYYGPLSLALTYSCTLCIYLPTVSCDVPLTSLVLLLKSHREYSSCLRNRPYDRSKHPLPLPLLPPGSQAATAPHLKLYTAKTVYPPPSSHPTCPLVSEQARGGGGGGGPCLSILSMGP